MKLSVLIPRLQELLVQEGDILLDNIFIRTGGDALVTLTNVTGWSKDFIITKPVEIPQSFNIENHED